jgi:hypothetical protein
MSEDEDSVEELEELARAVRVSELGSMGDC